MKITAPKTDAWLVKTFGIILAVIGAALLFARARGELNCLPCLSSRECPALLTSAEFIYVFKKVISPVYLLDAAVELVFIGWWLVTMKFA